MDGPVVRWLRLSLFNLLLVALLGLIMRYKIVFPLAWVDQRNLLHAHSHFAFSGWITQALISLLVGHLSDKGQAGAWQRYRILLVANLVTAYGMLVTFPFLGYSFWPILFSTLSILVSYGFAVMYWRDLDRLAVKRVSHHWFKAAALFSVLSSLGAFYLAYMLATRNLHPNYYLASVYFFLHFQYNGWFFFACMGLLADWLSRLGAPNRELQRVFWLFAAACVPAYFLSALWLPVARWLYLLIVLAVLVQLWGWWKMLVLLRGLNAMLRSSAPVFGRRILLLSGIALSIKLLLQAGSVIPPLSRLAFGFRPIVIGYLHLVLLGVISLFILGYCFSRHYFEVNRKARAGMMVLAGGIVLNELLLMVQGISDMNYTPVGYLNEALLVVAGLLVLGIILLNLGQFRTGYDPAHKMTAKSG